MADKQKKSTAWKKNRKFGDVFGGRSLVNGKGIPEGDCENCLACVHNCPQKAISIIPTPPEPEEPNRNVRYRNPNVKLGDLIRSNCQS